MKILLAGAALVIGAILTVMAVAGLSLIYIAARADRPDDWTATAIFGFGCMAVLIPYAVLVWAISSALLE